VLGQDSDAHRKRDRSEPAADVADVEAMDPLADQLGAAARGLRRRATHQQREFIAAIARDDVLTAQHRREAAPATVSATAIAGRGATAAYARHVWPLLSRRTLVLLSILALHVVVIYCFANGLARTIIIAFTQPIHAGVIVQQRPRDVPPPPPTLTFVHPSVDIPPPDLPLNVPAERRQITVPPVRPPQRVEVPSYTAVAPQRVLGGPDRGFPDTDDYYPTNSRRLGETGSSVVQVCVDVQGRLTALPIIAQSSGSARLDAGAIALAKAGTGHYRPTTEDGRPVPSCYAFRIRFMLRE
jgi:periplasmic protein TonB